MAELIYTGKGNVKSYNGGTNAYTFYLEVKLNSQSVDNNKSNITINHYAHGNNGWNYSLYSQPRSYIKLYDSNTGSTVTKKETKVDEIPNGTKTLIGTWTGDVTHKPDGSLDIKITAEYKANTSNTSSTYYMPNNSTLSSGTLQLPDLHTPPSIESATFTENNATLTNAGVTADTLVPYLSNKTIAIGTLAFDSATISKYEVTDGARTYSSTSSSIAMNLANGLTYSGTTAELKLKITDSMGSVGSKIVNKIVIPYNLPNLIATSSNVKRNGQTTGKVLLNLKGTFYNAKVGTLSNTISLKFAYWKTGNTESATYYAIPSTAYTISGNNITITNWAVAKNGTVITDVDKSSGYQFKIQATDAFGKVSTIQLNCTSGEYLMAKYKDRVDFKKITQKNKELWDILHPIGSIFITSTNTNPNTMFGGTWSLIDKGFNPGKISNPFTINSTNLSSGTVNVHRSDHSITLTGTFVNKVAFTDSTQDIGQLNLSSIGISQFPEQMRFVGYSDGGNSMVQLVLGTGGDIEKVDVEYSLTSVASGKTWVFSFTSVIDDSAMLDSACTKFYWKRTA